MDYKKKSLNKINKKDTSRVKFLFLGNYIKTKGVCDYLMAIGLLDQNYIADAEFYIAGNKREEDTYNSILNLISINNKATIINCNSVVGEEKVKLLNLFLEIR